MTMRSRIVIACVAALLAVPAMGQTSQPDRGQKPPPAAKDQSDDPGRILGGPEITENSDRPIDQFGRPNQRGRAQQIIPVEQWLRVLRTLKLTDEQRGAAERMLDDYRRRAGEFREKYGRELQEINRARQKAREDGRDFDPALNRKARQIMAQNPSAIEAQQQIWQVLTDDQQDAMREQLAELRTQRLRQFRNDRAGDDRMGMEGGGDRFDDEGVSRNLGGHLDSPGLDEAGQRRLRFLRRFQKGRQPGAPPTAKDREFDFDD